MDIPLSYEMLNVSSHGRVISTALHSSPLVPSEDVTNVPVLLSRKRGRTIVVEPSFTKKRNVIIHRLYDCQLFLFGAVDDVIISNCRNTTIFIPIVTGCMSVMTCSNVTITGMCTSFRIDCDSETANMQTNFAYLGTPTRPLVIHSPENDLTCSSICFAPCNKWYKGFFQDLEQHGFNTTMNLWNDPLSFTDQKLFHLLAPHQFTMTEIPFDINPVQTYAAAAEPMKKDTDDHNQFLKMLPCSYATWIVEMNTLHQKTRLIMEQATAKDPMLKTRMEKEFHNWLKQSNNIISVANLMGMQQETSD
jgi:hypothetical protein